VREEGAALVDGVARLRERDRVLAALEVDDDVGEREDRLLAAERRHDLRVRVERGAEAPLRPGRDRLAQLGQADRGRVAHPLAQPVHERLPDHRVGRLARVAHAEVDHLDAALAHEPRRLVQAHERVRGLPFEDGGDGHG
jgi:hypothetical protein